MNNNLKTILTGLTLLTSGLYNKIHTLSGTKADIATTLSGYGITDAKIENGIIYLGDQSITPAVSSIATEEQYGFIKLATQELVNNGTDDTKAVTAKKINSYTLSIDNDGIVHTTAGKLILDQKLNKFDDNPSENKFVLTDVSGNIKYSDVSISSYLPLSGGELSGTLKNEDYTDIKIYVGLTRDITTVEQAFLIAKTYYIPCGTRTTLYLDPYKADGVTRATYPINNPIYFDYIRTGLRTSDLTAAVHPLIYNNSSSNNIQITLKHSALLSVHMVDLQQINFVVQNQAVLYLQYLTFDHSNDNSTNYCLNCDRNSLTYCLNISITGNVNYSRAMLAFNNSTIVFEGSSTISNCDVGVYCWYNSFVNIPSSFCTFTNVAMLSTPAINTIGNANSYVLR